MRIAVLIAASVLVAGCSQTVGGQPQRTDVGASASAGPAPSATTTRSAAPGPAPAAGASIDEVIEWIEAGTPADAASYHSATRDGVTTPLNNDVAFVTPAGNTECMTTGGALACLVDLDNPPPRPADVYGEWKGGWVDFGGNTLQVGSAHGDPGPFSDGTGPGLPAGAALAFGDYRCRTDPAALYCVNYAHRSAVRFSDAGIDVFGCLQEQPQSADGGIRYSC